MNIDLAVDVLVHIELHPEHWDQENWAITNVRNEQGDAPITLEDCGTAGCFAGWALSIKKVPLAWEWYEYRWNAQYTAVGHEHVSTAAANLLEIYDRFVDVCGDHGTDLDQCDSSCALAEHSLEDVLFRETNTLDDLYSLVSEHGMVPIGELRLRVALRKAELEAEARAKAVTK